MTEYTREIKPVDINAAPQVAAPTGSPLADVANLAATGLEVFAARENQKRELETNKMIQSLSDFEVELTKNGLSRTDVLSRLDQRIKQMSPDSGQQSYLRARLAQQRGGFVRNQIVQSVNSEEDQRQQELERDYQQALNVVPDLFGAIKRDANGEVAEAEKVRVINQAQERVMANYRAQQQQTLAQEQLAQGEQVALDGAVNLSSAINIQVGEKFRSLADTYVSYVNSLDIQDAGNAQLLSEAGANLRNLLGMVRGDVESQYNEAYTSQQSQKVRDILEKNRDSTLKQLDSISTMLSSDDVNQSKRLASQIEYLQNNLKLNGLQNFSLLAMIEEIAPQSGRYITEALYVKRPDIFAGAEEQIAIGLGNLVSQEGKTMEFAASVMNYMNNNQPEKASDLVLSTFYDYTKKVINSPEGVGNLSPVEMEKISGGLLGILSEAAATDDPKQIRDATAMLNSDNFSKFFEQLPEDKKAPMGRFISSFTEDVLIDSTDGVFKKLSDRTKDASITYNTTTGKFEMGDVAEITRDPFAYGIQREGSTGFKDVNTKRIIEREVQKANMYLDKVRDMSQYDPSGIDGTTYVDTLLSKYLPSSIKVKGTLQPYQEEVLEKQVVTDTSIDNKKVITDFQKKISEYEKLLLENNISTGN